MFSPAEINKAGRRRHRGGSKFVSSRARAKRNARNYSLEMSITRLLFAICGVSRGASALWSHTARAKNAHHRAKRAGEGGKQSEKREIHHPKKKRKNPSRKSARAKLRKESSKRRREHIQRLIRNVPWCETSSRRLCRRRRFVGR